MVRINYDDMIYEGDKACKTDHDFRVFDIYGHETDHVSNIYGAEWGFIRLEDGEWSEPYEIASESEVTRADIDFLTMENEYLEAENQELREAVEADRADIDYCLMLLEE